MWGLDRWRVIGQAGACLALVAALSGGARRADGAAPVDYARQVKPLLKARCLSCHGALKQKAGLRLDTVVLLRKGGDGGPAVEPGSADDSELIDRVTQTDLKLRMPPEGPPLSAEQVTMLRAWVNEGARGPADEVPEADPRRHWAFVPPTRPAVPTAGDGAGVRNPIDAFLAAGRARAGVGPLPPAAPEVLLRRVSIDLTGLPPTREERREFLRDPSDVAYAKVVDRLLASPQYGERWARHWMDVWRYSDWYGRRAVPDVTNSYAMIWRWRDWIVRSLNDDRGYDAMVRAMLAADELAPGDDAEAVALGFVLRNFYRWNYNLWMKDSVEHTAKAFLGLTLQCAHCHDHKYDPLTQDDYFAFRAFFEPLEVRHDRVPGEPDPGPFPKYVYGAAYKPITSGLARVFDEKLDAQTFVYSRGESRNVIPGRPPVAPGVPRFLRPAGFQVTPVDLPAEAYYPALKPFARREDLARADAACAAVGAQAAANVTALAAAEGTVRRVEAAWLDRVSPAAFLGRNDVRAFATPSGPVPADVQAARDVRDVAAATHEVDARLVASEHAKRASLRARFDAELTRHARRSGDAEALARAASVAERSAPVAFARLQLAVDAKALLVARQKARTDPKAAAEVAAAEQQATAHRTALAAAEAALAKESTAYTPLGPVYPSRSTGRRAALAQWVTARENPLTARVAVNHVWRWHFHRPIVATTHDFGRNGRPPTHPELLDWLAVELMDPSTPGAAPWSMKALHRLIVTSEAYRMRSSTPDPDHPARRLDPDNASLWHFPPARMEAEVVRDGLLHVAGALDRTIGGPDIDFNQGLTSRRRSLYFTHHGEARMPFLELFDAPDACDAYVRTVSVVPQQALALTNNDLARSLASSLAARLWGEAGSDAEAGPDRASAFVAAAFEQVLSRAPTPRERAVSLAFLTRQTRLLASDPPLAPDAPARARGDLVQALFSHNDFVTVH